MSSDTSNTTRPPRPANRSRPPASSPISSPWCSASRWASSSWSPASCRRSPAGRTTTPSTARCSSTSRARSRSRFYTVIPVMVDLGRVHVRQPDEELGARRTGPAPHHHEERRAAAEGLPRRRLHADAAARRRRRPHALDDLLRVPGAARRHHRARDRPPAARGAQVPARHHLQGVRVRRRRRRARVPRRHRLGDRAPLRPAPYRIRIKSKPEHAAILGTFFAVGVTGFGAEMFRIAQEGMPDYEQWAFIGYPLATLVDGWSAGQRSRPGTSGGGSSTSPASSRSSRCCRSRCCATSSPRRSTCTSSDKDRPKGAMRRCRTSMETELESFGASTVEDFTWKQLLDLDACTMCGRCTSVCPAHATGKPLDPREIVLKSGEVMAATGYAGGVARRSAPTPRSRSAPTRCSSASRPRRSGPARPARRATRSARSTSRSPTRSSTCGATCR